ncbi:SusC/RagA family TonB-linked outer membrane protein [Sphingobacterium hungaricum]
MFVLQQDSTSLEKDIENEVDPSGAFVDTVVFIDKKIFTDKPQPISERSLKDISLSPFISLQQLLKAEKAGLTVFESTGEPGTNQHMFIRGISRPLLSKKDSYQSQPLVVLDGIPLIGEHPFSYMIQSYDLERIGTENNLLANIDIDNIESIRVLKDLSTMAIYGPMAANGVIEITSKRNVENNDRRISLNAFSGFVQRPSVTTINGSYENNFRKQFYDLYTTNGKYSDDDNYPVYLGDSLNNAYYGVSNWSDSYYKTSFQHGINGNISGGGPRANFQFALGNIKNSGIADQTQVERYNARFLLNLKPVKWLTFSSMINGNRLDRDRNRNLSSRYAMMSYFPDLSAPLAPNKEIYDSYLAQYDNSFDDNFSNIVEGYVNLKFEFEKFRFQSRIALDYNESYRDVFYSRPLMESNSFASNYYGFNQRLIFDNVASYDWMIDDKNTFYVEAGGKLQWDAHKYNYAYAYKGVNDFIKVNLLDNDPRNGDNPNYLNPTAFPRQLVYKYLDRTRHNLVSFHTQGTYNYDKKYTASVLLRYDGSSNAQPLARWLFTPVVSLGWNIKEDLLKDNSSLQGLNLRASAGRIGVLNQYDDFSQGPNYTAQVGFTGNVTVPGYNGFAVLTRPYESGWVGYDIPWAYSDQTNLGIDASWEKRGLYASVDVYLKETKNQLIPIPSLSEYGYRYMHSAGMSVQNSGIDISFGGNIIENKSKELYWKSGLNFSFNSNKLTALPNGLDELVIDGRLLKVGERIDKFWLFENQGIYLTDADVPEFDGKKLAYNGITMKAGDPIWKDANNDQQINEDDRQLMGNIMPKVSGNWYHTVNYKNWDLNVNLFFNLGRQVVNQEMSNRFNFINNEGSKDLSAIKEITYWEKRGDYSKYPIYNPWSSVNAYQTDQDLFLENASFLKLRTVSLGYKMTDKMLSFLNEGASLYLYVTANNLFTITPYSGRDPELVNFLGYDNGNSHIIPKTYTIGFKLGL